MMMMMRRRMISMEEDDGDADDDYEWMTRIETMTTLAMTRMMSPDSGLIQNTSGQTRLHQIKDM